MRLAFPGAFAALGLVAALAGLAYAAVGVVGVVRGDQRSLPLAAFGLFAAGIGTALWLVARRSRSG